MLLGAHLSIAGGLHRALERASRHGFRTVALFVRNQRQWRSAPLSARAVRTFRLARRRLGIDPVLAHGSYLLNLAGSGPVRGRSLAAAAEELDRCHRLGIEGYVLHPGSYGRDTRRRGIRRLSEALNALAERTAGRPDGDENPPARIVLETTAGAGRQLGGTFDDLAEILGGLSPPGRFGVCLDTCHVFAAGYDIRTPKGYRRTLAEFDRLVGLARLAAIHLNDSLGGLGSRLDRHTHVGQGRIGLAGFACFVTDPRLQHVPMLLETPKGLSPEGLDLDAVNARAIRTLAQPGAAPGADARQPQDNHRRGAGRSLRGRGR